MARSFVGINIEGIDELKAKLQKMGEDSRSDLIAGWAKAAADIILQAARALAPTLQHPDPRRVPGLLRDWLKSLKSRASKAGNVTYRVGIPGSFPLKDPDFYPAYVEYGTRLTEAQPYMRPAFDAKQEEARDLIAAEALAWLRSFEE